MSDLVRLERTGGLATLTLDRPPMNSLNIALKEELLAALREVRDDGAVRALLLAGSERAFCVGQDLKEHIALIEAGDPAPMETARVHYNPITLTLATMPKPVVAAVRGVAAGAGASFAFAADFRIAGESASFLLAFAKIGLSVDSGASWLLPRLVGYAKATELCLLGDAVPAAEALRLGLVTRVVPDGEVLDTAGELAGRLAEGPTVAYGAIKEALAYGAAAELAPALEKEAELQARAGSTADHRAAVEAFVAKRPPLFEGR
ncbi:MAG: enoyl-CoA hydratase-related protein [Mycobacteriales bacterium]